MTILEAAVRARDVPAGALAGSPSEVAVAARAMAGRFMRGGRLLVFGSGRAAADAEHVSVEFVHPVIVGKRALPALTLTGDVATITGVATGRGVDGIFAHQVRLLGRGDDMALGLSGPGGDAAVDQGLDAAGRAGLLTLALTGGAASGRPRVDHLLAAASEDPLVVKEVQVTTYHVLWELVHVFLDRPEETGR